MQTAGSPLMGAPNVGSSAVFGPDGRLLSAPETANEELVFADLDMASIVKAKTFADASGHYSRPDLLWLGADRTRRGVVVAKEGEEGKVLPVVDKKVVEESGVKEEKVVGA